MITCPVIGITFYLSWVSMVDKVFCYRNDAHSFAVVGYTM